MVALRGVLADADDGGERLALAALDHQLLDDPRHLPLGHPGLELAAGRLPDLAVQLLRGAKRGDLVRRLHRANRRKVLRDVDELRLRELLLPLEELRMGNGRLVADSFPRSPFPLPQTLNIGDLQLRR